jgi:hypothetical protein
MKRNILVFIAIAMVMFSAVAISSALDVPPPAPSAWPTPQEDQSVIT